MAKVTVYKNSKFSTFLSILGYLLMVAGIYMITEGEAAVGAILIVAGIGVKLLAGFISKKKQEKENKAM